ncbi:MAG: hypothetical protein INR71_00010 [Terriglobus roseus]|nr:hypothetical protein [Terriglobus roseus]
MLPSGWFPGSDPSATTTSTPVLDAVLQGLAEGWRAIFDILVFTCQQTRLATARAGYLDLIARDFFGGQLLRQAGDTDEAFRARLQANLLTDKATRSAVSRGIKRLTGVAPVIHETRQGDGVGGYGHGGYGSYGYSYGSRSMPFQALVTCFQDSVASTRQSSATSVDEEGRIRVAPPYLIRRIPGPDGSQSMLQESRGCNLIKDDGNWARLIGDGCSNVSWIVEAGDGRPFARASVLAVSALEPGQFISPARSVLSTENVVTGSLWLNVRTGSLSSLTVRLRQANTGRMAATSAAITSGWQRVCVSLADANGRLFLELDGVAISNTVVVESQCWQIEGGPDATSYIPANGCVGIREADQLVELDGDGSKWSNQSARDDVLLRSIPVGVRVWVRDIRQDPAD